MTSELISCPQCGESINPNSRDCGFCSVNLALSALFAEQNLRSDTGILKNYPISPEILVPRLGDYLIEKGVLKPKDLQSALDYQVKLGDVGKTRLIGQTLLDLGFIERETLDQAITEQIFQLHFALQNANEELENRVRERTAELESALNRLAELNQLKSNFIANISHELRTPLTHIRGYLELLVFEGLGPLSVEQKDALGVMIRSEERLEKLIEDLIQFSLVARGELDLSVTEFDLHDVIDEVIMGMMQRCSQAQLSLQTSVPKELPIVKADRQKIYWVLNQLMDNAIKFTPAGGQLQIRANLGDKRVVLAVVDTGIGISEEQIKEIFEPFHQLDGSATRRYGGTGLGLAMVRQIVEAHGSMIIVKSTLGKGTYFEFSLPTPN